MIELWLDVIPRHRIAELSMPEGMTRESPEFNVPGPLQGSPDHGVFIGVNLKLKDFPFTREYAIDLRELVRSAHAPGGYYIFTCGCGDAGDAGIEKPVTVEHNQTEVIWNLELPVGSRDSAMGGPGGEQGGFAIGFDKDEYRNAIRPSLELAKYLIREFAPFVEIGPFGLETADILELTV